MRGVLADTGPLYALVDRNDQYHLQARAEARRLRQARLWIALAYPLLLETYTLVVRRLGVKTAIGWLGQVREGSAFLNPSEADYLAASALVGRFKDQPITLFDAVLARLSQELEMPVWTYDHHFDLMGAEVWR